MAEPLNRKMADQSEVLAACEQIEGELAELRAAYEQYFLGLEKKPPADRHKDLKRRLQQLKQVWVRQTAAKFRVQNVQQKFSTYERLWSRTLQEIENGTYHRDVARARRKSQASSANASSAKSATRPERDDFAIDEVSPDEAQALLSGAAFEAPRPAASSVEAALAAAVTTRPAPASRAPSVPPITPTIAPVIPPAGAARPASQPPSSAPRPASQPPSSPRAAAPSSPSSAGSSAVSDDKLRAVYDAYVKAKKRCNEDVSSISYDQVATTLKKQVPELMKKHNAKAVEFKVVIKDGKAVLRAVPKEG